MSNLPATALPCEACLAAPGVPCDPFCVGLAAHDDGPGEESEGDACCVVCSRPVCLCDDLYDLRLEERLDR